MANIKSAKKRAKQNIKRKEINQARVSEIKTYTKNILKALDDKNVEAAKKLFKVAQTQIARAKGKKIIKANSAARKISRLAKKIFSAEKVQ
jgi:small subunit ribosomal protein S20